MNSKKSFLNTYTLSFLNEDLEKEYQSLRVSLKELPLWGKISLWALIIFYGLRRLQLILEAIYGDSGQPLMSEIRITLEFLGGLLYEIPIYFIPKLSILRGFAMVFCGLWSTIDASCLYYPSVPTLVPS